MNICPLVRKGDKVTLEYDGKWVSFQVGGFVFDPKDASLRGTCRAYPESWNGLALVVSEDGKVSGNPAFSKEIDCASCPLMEGYGPNERRTADVFMGKTTGIYNAKIVRTHMGPDDSYGKPFLSATLFLEFEDGNSAYPVNVFDPPRREFNSLTARHILQLLSVLEVHSWEGLTGTFCRVEKGNHMYLKIGHVVKDQWFEGITDYIEASGEPEDSEV